MKPIITKVIIFCILPSLALSQAEFIEVGKNAFGISGMYQSESESDGSTTTLAGQFSYIFSGNLDIMIELGLASYSDDTDEYWDSQASGITFGGYYHIKNPTMPFNIKVGGFYGTASLKADYLDDLDWTAKGKASGFGGGVYKKISQSNTYSLIPFANFHSITSEITIEDSYGDSLDEDDNYHSFSFGLTVKFNNNLWIAPTIGQVDGESEFSLQFGMLFPQ